MAVTVNTRRVRPRAAQPVFDSGAGVSAAFRDQGAGLTDLGRAVSQAGGQISALAFDMAREDNETRAKEADARMAERIRRITMGDPGDPDAPPGQLTLRGKDALVGFGPAEEAVRAAVQQELDQVQGNPAATRAITQLGNRRIQQALDRMTAHSVDQRLVVQEQASLAREAQALADVSSDWQSDEALEAALATIAAEVTDRADAAGMDDVTAAALLAERRSVIVKGAFDAALVGQDVARAQAIFSKHADVLTGPVRTTMAQALAADVRAEAAQSLAQEAFARHRGDPAGMRRFVRDAVSGAQESAAIDELNALIAEQRGDTRFALAMQETRRSREAEERALASAARAQANHLHTVSERERMLALRQASEEAYNFLYSETASLREFRRRNPEAYDLLAGAGQIESLQRVERGIREGEVYAEVSNGTTLSEVKAMPYQERAQVQPDALRRQVTEVEFRQLVSSVESAKRKVESDRRDRALYNSGDSELRRLAPRGFKPDGSRAERNQMALAEEQMDAWITGQLEAGNYPSPPEVAAEAARIMLPISVVTGWFDSISDFDGLAAAASGLTAEQRALVTVPREQIPDPVVNRLMGVIDQGWPGVRPQVTDDVLEQLAGAYAVGDRERMEGILDSLEVRQQGIDAERERDLAEEAVDVRVESLSPDEQRRITGDEIDMLTEIYLRDGEGAMEQALSRLLLESPATRVLGARALRESMISPATPPTTRLLGRE